MVRPSETPEEDGGLVGVREDYEDERHWLRSGQVADLLQISPKTVSRYASEGKLPFIRTEGGHRRFPRKGVLDTAALWQERFNDDNQA